MNWFIREREIYKPFRNGEWRIYNFLYHEHEDQPYGGAEVMTEVDYQLFLFHEERAKITKVTYPHCSQCNKRVPDHMLTIAIMMDAWLSIDVTEYYPDRRVGDDDVKHYTRPSKYKTIIGEYNQLKDLKK